MGFNSGFKGLKYIFHSNLNASALINSKLLS
jgi:hypothetical protein